MNDECKRAVTGKCRDFTRQSGIEVSPETESLIAGIISAIVEDPHPSWKVQGDELKPMVAAYITGIPMILFQVATSQRVEQRISAFDFLHWFSRSFEQTMCIIPKNISEHLIEKLQHTV